MPTASVVINTYRNRPEHLIQAIDSYLAQERVDMQVIISTVAGDTSIEIAKQKGLDLVISDEPGIYQQLNKAIEAIKGDWYAYASGNDVARPSKMGDEIDLCLANNKKICYSDYYLCNEWLRHRKHQSLFDYSFSRHFSKNFVSDCATVEINLLRKYMPFKIEWGNHAYWDLWLRIGRGEGDVFIHNPNAEWYYRLSPDSQHIKRKKDPEKFAANKLQRKRLLAYHRELG